MIEIQNLSFGINDDANAKEILKNVNLTLENGKNYVITGPNGSGKTTLVKLIMGLLKPCSGRIIFDGVDITDMKINERANLGISYAFQQPVTFKGLKVRDLLDIASGKKNDFGQICDVLSKVGLCAKDYVGRPLDNKLSGGELKRIELAMMLCRKARLNIFDEPEAGIDLWSFEQLTELFRSLKNSTNIIVSHQKKVLEIADEVILLSGGEVVKIGSADEILPLTHGKCRRLGGENE